MAERISHADCDHPSTPGARAICRRNQQKLASGKIKDTPGTRRLQDTLTEQYRDTLLALADLTTAEVKDLIKNVDLEDIDKWFKSAMPELIKVIEANHRDASLMTVSYLRQHAALQGFNGKVAPAKIIREQLLTSLEVTGPVAFKKHVGAGGTPAEAKKVMTTTLSGSGERLAMAGARDTLDAAVADPTNDVLGYKRRTSGQACDYCRGLSKDAVYENNTFHAHDHCTCTGEPLYLDRSFMGTQTIEQLANIQVDNAETVLSITNALEAIAKVHRVTDKVTDGPYQVKFTDSNVQKLGSARGAFGLESGERTIRLDPKAPGVEFTAVHEFGHHLDFSMFSPKGSYYATRVAIDRVSPEFEDLFKAIMKTPEYKEWLEFQKVPARKKYFTYILNEQELFARAYAQWITLRSQSPELLKAIKADIPTRQIHWDDKNFGDIAKEFDKIFKERGLLV